MNDVIIALVSTIIGGLIGAGTSYFTQKKANNFYITEERKRFNRENIKGLIESLYEFSNYNLYLEEILKSQNGALTNLKHINNYFDDYTTIEAKLKFLFEIFAPQLKDDYSSYFYNTQEIKKFIINYKFFELEESKNQNVDLITRDEFFTKYYNNSGLIYENLKQLQIIHDNLVKKLKTFIL